MLTKKTTVLVLLLCLTVVFSAPLDIPRAHGVTPTGEVCLVDPTSGTGSATPCPTNTPVFAGPKGEQIRIGVFIQGSYNVTGFDITILTNHTFLTPTGVDLTGTVLPGTPIVLLECLQNVKISGTVCPPTDTIDTLTYAVSAGLGQHTTSPTTGLLFTAIYNMTSTTTVGGITVGYQTGCTGTSVTGGDCVTIAGGLTDMGNNAVPDPETDQAGIFDNSGSATMAFVQVSSSPTGFGPEFPGTANTATITATSENMYGACTFCLYTDQVTFTITKATSLLIASLSGTNPCPTGGTGCSVSLSLSATTAGTYFVTIAGTYASVDSSASSNPDTLVSSVTLSVVVDDFGFAITPTPPAPITFISGSTGVATITLSSLNGFAGSVSLSTGTIIPGSPPLTITYSPNPVTLSAGQTLTSTVTLSASPTSAVVYHAQIKAASGTQSKTITPTINVNLGDLTTTALSCVPGSTQVFGSSTCTATVTDTHSSPTTPSGTLSFTTDGAGSFNSAGSCTLSAGTTGTAACQVAYTPTSIGSGTHNITAIYPGDTTHGRSSGFFLLKVTPAVALPDFNVTANPTSIGPLDVNAMGTSTITVNSLVGFSGTVNLSANPPAGLNANVSPASVTISATTPGTATLTVSAAVVGNYTLTVIASNSTTSHSTAVIQVSVVDFGLASNPSTLQVGQGTFETSNITITRQNGFSGSVSLSAVASTGLTVTITPNSISGSEIAVLNVTAATSLALGTYSANLTGTSGTLSHNLVVVVTVLAQNFTIVSNPPTITVGVLLNGMSTITLSSVAGFSGTVALTLALPTGVTGFLSQTSLTLAKDQTAVSVLTVNASIAGTFLVNVTGTSGSLVNTITIPVHAIDFSLSANPTSVLAFANTAATSTLTVAPVAGSTGTVALTASVSQAGLTCSLTPQSLVLGASQTSTLSCNGSAGTYTVTVTGVLAGVTHKAIVTYTVTDFSVNASPSGVTVNAGVLGNSTITVAPLNGFTGTVILSFIAPAGLTCTLTPSSVVLGGAQTSTLSCSSSTATNFQVIVTGASGSLSRPVTVNYAITDFALTVSSPTLTVAESGKGYVAVTVAGVNGFTGTVTLKLNVITNIPPGPTQPIVTLDLYSVTLTGSNEGVATMNVTVGPRVFPGNYGITVNATSGSLHDQRTVILTVPRPDFTISTSAQAAIIRLPGAAGIANITLSALDGFNGSVTFSVIVAPSTGLTCGLSRSSVVLVPGGSNLTVLSCQGSAGDFAVTVTGTAVEQYASGTQHNANVGYSVVDFTVSATPTGILINTGQPGHASVNVTWTRGYSGTVSLTAVPSSGLLTASIPGSLTGSGILTLTVNSDTAGVYTVVVKVTSGSTVHTVTVTVTVSSVSNAPNILGLDPTVFYAIVGVLAFAVIGSLVAVSRRGRRSKK